MDLNRQGKMYSQGMAPVYRINPGKMKWERIQDKPVYGVSNFIYTVSSNPTSFLLKTYTFLDQWRNLYLIIQISHTWKPWLLYIFRLYISVYIWWVTKDACQHRFEVSSMYTNYWRWHILCSRNCLSVAGREECRFDYAVIVSWHNHGKGG